MAGFNDFLFGTPEKTQQFQRFNPQQQGALSSLLQQGLGGLSSLQNNQLPQLDFEPIAQEARTQFHTNTIPSLASRFTNLNPGSQGGQRSSAFQAALGNAASGLEQNLASQRAQFGLQNRGLQLQERGQQQNLLQNLLGMGLQPQFENLLRPRQAGFVENTSNKVAEYLPTILGALFGIPLPPMGGGQQQQQQGGGLYALSGGLGGQNNYQSPNFGGMNFGQMFGQGNF